MIGVVQQLLARFGGGLERALQLLALAGQAVAQSQDRFASRRERSSAGGDALDALQKSAVLSEVGLRSRQPFARQRSLGVDPVPLGFQRALLLFESLQLRVR